ncbi:MAG: hypothetical protein V1722_01060 [Candidatus Micrarchaeota archaeon]
MSKHILVGIISAILLLVTQVNAISLYSSEAVYSTPVTAYVGTNSAYYVSYTGNENGTVYQLTPSKHGASCNLVFANVTFPITYNETAGVYEKYLVYSEIGNYSFSFECSATEYKPAISFNVQEVAQGKTAILLSEVNPSSSNFSLSARYYSTGSGDALTQDNNATCTAYIYNETELVRAAQLIYDKDKKVMTADVELGQRGAFTWNISCSASPNFEPATSEGGSFTVPYATVMNYTPLPTSALIYEAYSMQYLHYSNPHQFIVEINYSAVFDNGTTYLITQPSHNGICYLTFDGYTLATDYNAEKQNYNTAIYSIPAGNYTPTIECSADNYETRSETGSNIEITPANTTMLLQSNTTGKTVTLTAGYYWTETSEKGGSISAIYEEVAACNASLYNSNNYLILETPLDLDGYGYSYVKTVTLGSAGSYYWNASCGGLANYKPASSTSDALYIENSECDEVNVISSTNVTSGKTCSSESSTPLYSITTNNVELNCNDNTFNAIGNNLQRAAIGVVNASNVTISNCKFNNYAAGITIYNATNVTLKNIVTTTGYNSLQIVNSSNVSILDSEFSQGVNDDAPMNARSAIYFIGNSPNAVFSNITIRGYFVGLNAENVTNGSLADFNLTDVYAGIVLQGNNNTLQRISLSNATISLYLIGENNLVENFTTRNSPAIEDFYPTILLITNKTTVTNLVVHNSSSDAIWLFGSDNTLSINLTSINGTALSLFGDSDLVGFPAKPTANNLIYLKGFTGNTLDIKMNDSTGELYNNTFIGNFSSIFANVTNATQQTIATFSGLTFTANGALVTYSNLTLLNSTGEVNITNGISKFTLTSTTVSLNSTATPFLSQFATITLTGASYANNSMYNILKDSSTCSNCIKLSSNPVAFQVFGFSSYTTSAVETPVTVTPPPVSPTVPSAGAAASGIQITAAVNPLTNTSNATSNNTNSKKSLNITKNNSSLNSTNNNQTQNTNSTSPLTGLLAAIPIDLNNPITVAVIALIAIATIGLIISSYITKFYSKPAHKKK